MSSAASVVVTRNIRKRPGLGFRFPIAVVLAAGVIAASLWVFRWKVTAFALGPPVLVGLLVVWLTRRLRLVGPLFYYDLARIAQRGRTTQLRCLYLVILTIVLAGFSFGQINDAGAELLGQPDYSFIQARANAGSAPVLLILTLQMMALLVITPAYLAGAFTEEKERKTLQFLFATDLRDRELVLGKLFGRLMLLGTILLVGLPLISLYVSWGPVEVSL